MCPDKNFCQKTTVGPMKFSVQQIMGWKICINKILGPKILGREKCWAQNKLLAQKNFGLKFFWVQTNCEFKKLGSKKIWVPKRINFVSEKKRGFASLP